MTQNLLERLQSSPSCLSKSEKKVAEVILLDPDAAIRSSIAALANAAAVSEPTVNRFCRSLDCSGFPDFKLRLAQCLVVGTPYINRNVEENDEVEDYSNKIFEGTLSTLKDAQGALEYDAINEVVQTLSKANKIEFYGLGGSGAVAMDAQHKFFRLNIPVVAYTDVLMQRMSAAAAQPGTAIVIISATGRTISLVETAEIAKSAGASVIGVTSPNSPLIKACDIALPVQSPEDTDIYTPMTSRIVQLTVMDVLATGISLNKGPEFQVHLEKVKRSLGATRYKRTDDE